MRSTLYKDRKMKNLFLSAVATALVFVIGCEKNNDRKYDNTLPGTWKEYQSFMSPGNGGAWNNINGVTIILNSDSTYATSYEVSNWGKSGRIADVTDSSFTIISNTIGFNYPRYCRYTIKDGVFEVWYQCFEGCGSRFRKIGE
ncbi:MAG: hypothetical protein HYX40_03165 [Sphingobacteriales bacterium]|nr:hypothetical protein [Sphingobacteriales bacterium]